MESNKNFQHHKLAKVVNHCKRERAVRAVNEDGAVQIIAGISETVLRAAGFERPIPSAELMDEGNDGDAQGDDAAGFAMIGDGAVQSTGAGRDSAQD